MTLRDRFEAKFELEPNTGCWLWTASCNSSGYGWHSLSNKTVTAHRAAYSLYVGPIPNGMSVCHTCDVPSCVNPAHLFLGTPADNMSDKVRKGRQYRPSCELHHNAKLTSEEVERIRAAGRSGEAIKALAARFRMSVRAIRRIVKGESWSTR